MEYLTTDRGTLVEERRPLTVEPSPGRSRRATSRGVDAWYLAGVAVGAVFILVTAVRQPLNWDEYAQVGPYDATSMVEIVGGTRQPPLDPLLGSLIEHLFGAGRFQHHLGPALAGIGTLVVFALLMRSLRLGRAGVVGLWALATAPLMVRYSAYARPYALPLFGMVLFAYGTHRWLETGRRGGLVLSAVAALTLPLTRVPEPVAFLVTTALALAWLGVTGRRRWSRIAGPAAFALGSVALVGVPLALRLKGEISDSRRIVDQDPLTALFADAPHLGELVTKVPGLLATWFPWWPLTLAVALLALLLPAARRRWTAWWFWVPFLAAPAAFMLAFHLLVQQPIVAYQPRHAYFWVIIYAVGVAAVASVAFDPRTRRPVRFAMSGLLIVSLCSQLPTTALVLTRNESPDWTQVARALTDELPDDALVIYDNPWVEHRAAFAAWHDDAWDADSAPTVRAVGGIAAHPASMRDDAPVYVLLLESDCTQCDFPHRSMPPWDREVPGWQAHRLDLLTLYSPMEGQHGYEGVRTALERFRGVLGTQHGAAMTVAVARMLRAEGREGRATSEIQHLRSELNHRQLRRLRHWANRHGATLSQFRSDRPGPQQP